MITSVKGLVKSPAPHQSRELGPKDTIMLEAGATIFIPPLCCGVIPHNMDVSLVGGASYLILSRLPGVFMQMNLIVNGGFVDAGEITTEVFNLSNKRIRVGRGMCISRLVAL